MRARNFKSEKGAALILILDQASDAGGDPTGAGSSIKSEWQNVLSIAARIRSYRPYHNVLQGIPYRVVGHRDSPESSHNIRNPSNANAKQT